MKFSTIALLSAVTGSSLAAFVNGTVTDIATTVVTITSCEENKCHETAVTTGLTTVTELETTYTTYCPLTTEVAHNSTAAPSSSTVAAESSIAPNVTSLEGGAGKIAVGGVAGLALVAALI